MHAHIEQHPVLVVCLVSGNVAEWAIKHSAETDGETFQDISFDGDTVTMYTDTGREVTFPESIYQDYAEPSACSVHMIREFDSRGDMGREYEIKPPVIAQVAGYRG
jgi:hypothetical protein